MMRAMRLIVLTVGFAWSGAAQQQPAPLSAVPLKGGVYWVKGGSGANTGFITAKGQVIAVDSKMTAASVGEEMAAIAKITPEPVKTVILTHSDGDHVNGLASFPKGVTIIAHSNARKEMEAAFQDPKMSALVPYLPNKPVAGNETITIGGVRIKLLNYGPAHTSGDLIVLLPKQKIAFVGDLVFVGRDPLIHRQKGGTSLGLVQTLRKMLTLGADTFIPGHADPLSKKEIRELLSSIEEKQAKVKAMIGEGKSWDDIRKAFNVPDAPATAARRPGYIEVIYLDLTGKK